jgi:hypothetical protein
MTRKKLIINNCFECPYHEGSEKKSYCGIDDDVQRTYEPGDEPPEWCSLEDA